MEVLHRNIDRRKVGSVLAVASLAVILEGCGHGSSELPADTPVTILDKSTRSRYVTAEESGGYPHYEDDYYLVVEQCEQVDPAIVEDDGCVDLTMKVNATTYENFDISDTIVFPSSRRAYPVND